MAKTRLLVLVATLFLTAGCGAGSTPPSVLLITIDALRADHLSIYGYPRDTSPAIDAFFSSGAVYERAYATETSTSPSVVSFLTGRLPQETGLRLFCQMLPEGTQLVSDHLSRAGYQTAAVVSNAVLTTEAIDLNLHFDYYDDYIARREPHRRREVWERIAKGTTNAVITWYRTTFDREKPFFVWVHYQDPHGPYYAPDDKPVDFDHEEKQYIALRNIPEYQRAHGLKDGLEYIDRYDEEIAYTDVHVGRLLDFFEEKGLLENTLVILSADHGESMMEHEEWFTHGYHVYEEIIRVPLLVRYPGQLEGERVSTRVSLVDVTPTILDVAAIEALPDMRGRPLQSPEARPIYAQGGRWRSMTHDDTKWLVEVDKDWDEPRRAGVYDLAADPSEASLLPWIDDLEADAFYELVATDPDPAGIPEEFVEGMLPNAPKVRPDVDDKTLERLRSLGYVK